MLIREHIEKLTGWFSNFMVAATRINPAQNEKKYDDWDFRSEWTWWRERCRDYNRQQKCSHLKGAHGNRASWAKDYNVSLHRFADGSHRIRCLNNCGFEVWDKLSWQFKWQYALKMWTKTTNTVTASQTIFPVCPKEESRNYDFSYPEPDSRFIFLKDDESPIKGRK